MNFNFNTNFSVLNYYYFSIYFIKGINSTDCCSTKVVFIYSIIIVIVVIFIIIIIIIIIIVIIIVIFVIVVIVIFITIVIVIFVSIVIVTIATPVIRVIIIIIIICWGLSVDSTLLRYYQQSLSFVFLYCVYLYLNIKRLCTL